MLCLEIKPGATGYKSQTDPLSYGGSGHFFTTTTSTTATAAAEGAVGCDVQCYAE